MRYKFDGLCKGNSQNSSKIFGQLSSDIEYQKCLEILVIFVIKRTAEKTMKGDCDTRMELTWVAIQVSEFFVRYFRLYHQ